MPRVIKFADVIDSSAANLANYLSHAAERRRRSLTHDAAADESGSARRRRRS